MRPPTGAGGKSCNYSLGPVPAIPLASDSNTVTLPSHPGSLALFQILDMNGVVAGQSGFQVYSDGKVQVDFRGVDLDQNTWLVELDKMVQLSNPSGTLMLTSYKKLTGAADFPYLPGSSGTYPEQKLPVTLSLGVNNLVMVWSEGPTNTVVHSSVVAVTLSQSQGQYTISVTNGYTQPDSNSTGIVVSPGEPLDFQVGSSDTADPSQFSWDFGDGSGPVPG